MSTDMTITMLDELYCFWINFWILFPLVCHTFVRTTLLLRIGGQNNLTLERRPVFCYVNGGRGVQKLTPLYLRNGLEFFDAVFTNR